VLVEDLYPKGEEEPRPQQGLCSAAARRSAAGLDAASPELVCEEGAHRARALAALRPYAAQVLTHVGHASLGEGAKALDYRHHLLSRLGEVLHVDVVALGAGREPARRMPQGDATLRFERHCQRRVAGRRDLRLRRQQEVEHPVAEVP